MGSDIQSLAIPAEGHGLHKDHAVGLTSLKIPCFRSESRSYSQLLSSMDSPVRKGFLMAALCIDFCCLGSGRTVIA
jgi:hypothetical protein